jgi:thiamine biosynthesis protein ThiI
MKNKETNEKVILISYGELWLKGKNKVDFENQALRNLKKTLLNAFSFGDKSSDNSKQTLLFSVEKIDGKILISGFREKDLNKIISVASSVFGFSNLTVAVKTKTEKNAILKCLEECFEEIFDNENIERNSNLNKNQQITFKVETKRADKTFPVQSNDFNILAGDLILNLAEKKKYNLKVDIRKPEIVINIDIRTKENTFVSLSKIDAAGGLPVGCSGRGLSLLSGGIDSPVSSYLIAKRGMQINYLHFESYPYTSEAAKQKVIDLAKKLKQRTMGNVIYFVSLKEVQEEIRKKANPNYMIILMRRIMIRVANELCKSQNYDAIITGENLGQVASQTVQNMQVVDSLSEHIILRPLVAFDKTETIKIAKKIETFETSILPYEDCCTIFMPESPTIKANISKVEIEEAKLDVEKLVQNCISSVRYEQI